MIKIDLKAINNIKEELAKIRLTVPYEMKRRYKVASNIMKKDVVKTIERGQSPVKGQKRFVDYSQNYKDAIQGKIAYRSTPDGKPYRINPMEEDYDRFRNKKLKPINMTLSGRMLKSIAARITQNGFTVYFTSKLAKIHSTEGPGGREDKIRKVVPTGTEKWRASVLTNAKAYLERKTINNVIAKLRRI